MRRSTPVRVGRLQPTFWGAAICAAVALWFALPIFGQQRLTAEQVESGFIYNFTKYVEWPAQTDEVEASHFHICVVGEASIADELDSAIQGKVANNRTILVRRINEIPNIRGCEILYVGNIPRATEEKLLAELSARPVLTVGGAPGFLRGEGMVTFVIEADRVRFDINVRSAERVNIHFDSRILAVARKRTEASR